MKAFLIAAVVAVLFVIGPVMAMRPSPRQKQLARLRQSAIAAGLRVRVGDRPGTARGAGPDAVCYGVSWPLEDLERVRGSELRAERTGEGAWRVDALRGPVSTDCTGALSAALSLMPAGVGTVIVAGSGLAAYWDERGTEADVKRIAQSLQDLAAAWTRYLETARRTAVQAKL